MSRREHYRLNTKYFGMPAGPTPPKPTPSPTPTATMPGSEDQFPEFADGDVLVVITAARRYKLHSTVLRRASPTISALFDQHAASELSSKMKRRGMTVKYRLHLTDIPEAGDFKPGVRPSPHTLKRVLFDESGNPSADTPALLGDANENGRVVPQFVLVIYITVITLETSKLTITGMGASSRSLLQPQPRHWRQRAGWHFIHPSIRGNSPVSGGVPQMRKSFTPSLTIN